MSAGPCYLVSGHDPFYGGTQEIDARIYRRHGAGRGRILFVPASGSEEGQRKYATQFARYADGLGLDMTCLILPEVEPGSSPARPRPGLLPVVRRFSDGQALERRALEAMFEEADYVYLGGGRPEHLLYAFLDLRLLAPMRAASERGVPLIGYSAGAYLLCDRWWELSGAPVLFRKGTPVAIPDEEGHALLGYQRVNFAEMYRESPLAQMMAHYLYGERFRLEDYEPEAYLRLFYRVHAGSGLLRNLFCRVHFELRYEHLNEFYLIKENFRGYCVVKLEDPEAVRVQDGCVWDAEGHEVRSVFTGEPIHLDQFQGIEPTLARVNTLSEAIVAQVRDLAPAARLSRPGGAEVRYFPVNLLGDRATHHLLLDADGAYVPRPVADECMAQLLRSDGLQVIYPRGFPLRF